MSDTRTEIDAIANVERILRSDDLRPERAHELAHELAVPPIQDVVRLVERVDSTRAALILRLLSRRRSIEVFDALDPRHQADLIGALQQKDVLGFFEALNPDDRVSLLDELPAEIAEALLRRLDPGESQITEVVMGYPKGSVGRRMSPEVPTVYSTMTAGQALEKLRRTADDVETIYAVPIVRHDRKLQGFCSFADIFTADEDVQLSEIMVEPVYAHAHDDAEHTARWFLALDYLALPVVDETNRLVGILTWDDAQDIVEEEDSEDTARSGGAEPLQQPYFSTPVMKLVRSRVVWLLVLAISALLTVQVLDVFEETLSQVVTLSLFIPLLTGTGGNTGNQAATTVTRSLALGDVRKRDILAVMWREMRVGLMMGSLLGVLGFGLASLVYGVDIGVVIGATLLAICTMSATVGGAMPIIAKSVGADPAVFSNPFISTFCDATGLIIYFAIAINVLGL